MKVETQKLLEALKSKGAKPEQWISLMEDLMAIRQQFAPNSETLNPAQGKAFAAERLAQGYGAVTGQMCTNIAKIYKEGYLPAIVEADYYGKHTPTGWLDAHIKALAEQEQGGLVEAETQAAEVSKGTLTKEQAEELGEKVKELVNQKPEGMTPEEAAGAVKPFLLAGLSSLASVVQSNYAEAVDAMAVTEEQIGMMKIEQMVANVMAQITEARLVDGILTIKAKSAGVDFTITGVIDNETTETAEAVEVATAAK